MSAFPYWLTIVYFYTNKGRWNVKFFDVKRILNFIIVRIKLLGYWNTRRWKPTYCNIRRPFIVWVGVQVLSWLFRAISFRPASHHKASTTTSLPLSSLITEVPSWCYPSIIKLPLKCPFGVILKFYVSEKFQFMHMNVEQY